MGSIRLNLSCGGSLRWPQLCSVCGNTATDHAKASRTVLTGFNYYVIAVGWTTQTHSISFPVCHKHKILCSILDFPSTEGFTYRLFAAMGVSAVVALILLLILSLTGLNKISNDAESLWLLWITSFLSICFFFFGEFLKPIRILNNKNNIIKIFIKNKAYKKAFMLLNDTYIMD
jgi:hypothetical protein